jgi:hypothetical protein
MNAADSRGSRSWVKSYLVRFKCSKLPPQPVTAASVQIHGEHLVFLRSDGSLAALFVLEIVESWSEVESSGPLTRHADAQFLSPRLDVGISTNSWHNQIHSPNRIATPTTRPMFSISVLYFHLRLATGDRGWGISVNQSEALSNSHQPQTYSSRVIRK